MKIRDIVNRDIVNLTNCEQEPIHIPGSIQPHGFLLGLKHEDYSIDFCSANTVSYTGKPHTEYLGKTFDAAFGNESLLLLESFIQQTGPLPTSLFPMQIAGKSFLCTVHRSGDHFIFEAEPGADAEKLPDIYGQTRQFLYYMEESSGLQALCQRVAENTRAITGYDRVMIYRFDAEYNGEVFAESRNEELEPFLGLHYPHTDIPPQARQLYLKNLVRLIADIGYQPVPIFTIDDRAGKNLDLSLSVLRSVSPIHVQYLQNMGVGATLTISLIHKGDLWGLIACHHYSAKNLLPEVKIAAQLQGHFITSQIDTRQLNEEYEIAKKCNLAFERMISTHPVTDYESFKNIVADPLVLEICNATGIAIRIGHDTFVGGQVPDAEDLEKIIRHFSENGKATSDYSSQIKKHIPDLKGDEIAGVLYHSFHQDGDDGIFWFRNESVSEMNWAGDPSKAIVKDANGLSPRNSFKLWTEIVKGRSIEWKQAELTSATQYANSLEKQYNLLIISEEERKYRELAELLRQTNAELENINWISTHDLQEPLRKIQLFASLLLDSGNEGSQELNLPVIQKINNSANRMEILLKDILKYTKVKNTHEALKEVSLTNLMKELLPEMEESLEQKNATIEVGELPTVRAIPFLQKQVFTNLMYNSLKFAAKDRNPHIKIGYGGIQDFPGQPSDRQYHMVHYSDNGIGFDQKYADSIFNVFTRLHSYQEYEGSGIGLALCKKIMQTQHGFITAAGTPGEGAHFYLYFPVNG